MQEHATGHGTFKTYVSGFIIALVLTLLAYLLAEGAVFTEWVNDSAIGLLGLLQAWALLYLFLDVGREAKPQWNFLVFLFTVMVTIILVVGSLWIMHHLNYNLMLE